MTGGRPLRGRLRPPGDKSISHRGLLFAALASGTSRIEHLADGADVASTRGALEALGVPVASTGTDACTVTGAGFDALAEPGTVIDCGNSGTTMRMLAGVLAGRPFRSVLDGDASLRRRPMTRVIEPLREMGARITGSAGDATAPIEIDGGELVGREHDLTVASAQVKTALLLAGLQAGGRTVVREPAPSRDHTERMLRMVGAPLERVDARTVAVTAGAPQPFVLDVPGDPSSAAFWAVAATIVPGSDVLLEDVALNPTRLGFVSVLRRMGAAIEVTETGMRLGEPVGELRVRATTLHGTVIAGDEIPTVIDELPVLAIAAAVAEGRTEVRDAAELRVKESDRIAAIEEVLVRLGATVQAIPDGLVLHGTAALRAGALESHGDHRIAMAASVGALAAHGESTVHGWRAVEISYPSFATQLGELTAP